MRTPNPKVARRGRLAAVIVGTGAMILALAGAAATAVVPAAGPSVTARPDGPRLSAADECREREFEILDSLLGSAEFLMPGDNKGMLRARSRNLGDWERVVVCRNAATGLYYFQLWFDRDLRYYVVSAEVNYPGDRNGMLRARATSVGPWELFFLEQHPWNVTSPHLWRGLYTIRSYQSGKYVAHEKTYPGDTWNMMRARSDVAGEWEAFYLWIEDW